MNMRKLSLSALVITGLVLGNIPARLEAAANVSYIPHKTILTVFIGLTAINYLLDRKESVKNPENIYKWSDLLSLDLEKTIGVLDEKVLGQKGKGSSIKLTVGDKEIKETSKTPATGICGKGHELLGNLGKATADTGKLLVAPAILAAIYYKGLKFTEKDGILTPSVNLKKLAKAGFFTAKVSKEA